MLPLALSARRTFQDPFVIPAVEPYWAAIPVWTVTHIFDVTEFNSRFLGLDSIVSFARLALCLFFAAAATGIWSAADRHRLNYTVLQE